VAYFEEVSAVVFSGVSGGLKGGLGDESYTKQQTTPAQCLARYTLPTREKYSLKQWLRGNITF